MFNILSSIFVDLIKAIRIKDWYYMLGIPLIAYVQRYSFSINPDIYLVMIYSVLFLSWGYLFNNFFDKSEDSEEKNFLVSHNKQNYWLLLIFIIFAGLSFYSYLIDLRLLLVSLSVLVLSIIYSVAPFRFKEIWFLSLLLNGMLFALLYFGSVIIVGSSGIDLTLLIFLIFVCLHSVHELEHKKNSFRLNAIYLLFSVLAILSYFFGLHIFILTIVYSMSVIAGIQYSKKDSPFLIRKRIRYISMFYGLILLLLV